MARVYFGNLKRGVDRGDLSILVKDYATNTIDVKSNSGFGFVVRLLLLPLLNTNTDTDWTRAAELAELLRV